MPPKNKSKSVKSSTLKKQRLSDSQVTETDHDQNQRLPTRKQTFSIDSPVLVSHSSTNGMDDEGESMSQVLDSFSEFDIDWENVDIEHVSNSSMVSNVGDDDMCVDALDDESDGCVILGEPKPNAFAAIMGNRTVSNRTQPLKGVSDLMSLSIGSSSTLQSGFSLLGKRAIAGKPKPMSKPTPTQSPLVALSHSFVPCPMCGVSVSVSLMSMHMDTDCRPTNTNTPKHEPSSETKTFEDHHLMFAAHTQPQPSGTLHWPIKSKSSTKPTTDKPKKEQVKKEEVKKETGDVECPLCSARVGAGLINVHLDFHCPSLHTQTHTHKHNTATIKPTVTPTYTHTADEEEEEPLPAVPMRPVPNVDKVVDKVEKVVVKEKTSIDTKTETVDPRRVMALLPRSHTHMKPLGKTVFPHDGLDHMFTVADVKCDTDYNEGHAPHSTLLLLTSLALTRTPGSSLSHTHNLHSYPDSQFSPCVVGYWGPGQTLFPDAAEPTTLNTQGEMRVTPFTPHTTRVHLPWTVGRLEKGVGSSCVVINMAEAGPVITSSHTSHSHTHSHLLTNTHDTAASVASVLNAKRHSANLQLFKYGLPGEPLDDGATVTDVHAQHVLKTPCVSVYVPLLPPAIEMGSFSSLLIEGENRRLHEDLTPLLHSLATHPDRVDDSPVFVGLSSLERLTVWSLPWSVARWTLPCVLKHSSYHTTPPSSQSLIAALIRNQPPPMPSRVLSCGFAFSPSQWKSLLQKNVRLSRPAAAVQCTLQLVLKSGVVEALRRVLIVCIEDSLLHPAFPYITHLACVASKKGTHTDSDAVDAQSHLRMHHVDELLTFVWGLAESPVKDTWNYSAPVTYTSLSNRTAVDNAPALLLLLHDLSVVFQSTTHALGVMFGCDVSPIVPLTHVSLRSSLGTQLGLTPRQQHLVHALIMRGALGGMKSDVALCKANVLVWTLRFAVEALSALTSRVMDVWHSLDQSTHKDFSLRDQVALLLSPEGELMRMVAKIHILAPTLPFTLYPPSTTTILRTNREGAPSTASVEESQELGLVPYQPQWTWFIDWAYSGHTHGLRMDYHSHLHTPVFWKVPGSLRDYLDVTSLPHSAAKTQVAHTRTVFSISPYPSLMSALDMGSVEDEDLVLSAVDHHCTDILKDTLHSHTHTHVQDLSQTNTVASIVAKAINSSDSSAVESYLRGLMWTCRSSLSNKIDLSALPQATNIAMQLPQQLTQVKDNHDTLDDSIRSVWGSLAHEDWFSVCPRCEANCSLTHTHSQVHIHCNACEYSRDQSFTPAYRDLPHTPPSLVTAPWAYKYNPLSGLDTTMLSVYAEVLPVWDAYGSQYIQSKRVSKTMNQDLLE